MPLVLGKGKSDYAIYKIYHLGTFAGLAVSEMHSSQAIEEQYKKFFNILGFFDFVDFSSAYPGNCLTHSKLLDVTNKSIGRVVIGDTNRIDWDWAISNTEINDPLLAPDYIVDQARKDYADTLLMFPTIEEVRLVDDYKEEDQEDGIVIPDEELWFCEDWKETT